MRNLNEPCEGMSVREECEGGRSVNEGMSERGVKWGRGRGGGNGMRVINFGHQWQR